MREVLRIVGGGGSSCLSVENLNRFPVRNVREEAGVGGDAQTMVLPGDHINSTARAFPVACGLCDPG